MNINNKTLIETLKEHKMANDMHIDMYRTQLSIMDAQTTAIKSRLKEIERDNKTISSQIRQITRTGGSEI